MWNVCIGTYTEPILFGTGEVFPGKGKGIYFCTFAEGALRCLHSVETRNPSYLCADESRRRIYAVNELKTYLGQPGGGCTELSYQPDGRMQILHTAAIGGADPCHVAMAPNGEFLGIANFAGGSLSILPLDAEGGILPEKRQVFPHSGKSRNPQRQSCPHAHSVLFLPGGQQILVPDLGTDTLVSYRCQSGQVTPDPAGSCKTAPGNGPRFGEFSTDGQHFYLVNELGCSVTHYFLQGSVLAEQETLPTLPPEYADGNICSDLHLTPNGKYLYASNRGHDSICCFSLSPDGCMKFLHCTPCGGKTPRNFAIDPRGEYMLVGNQDSDTISIFAICRDGQLFLRDQVAFPSPVCIRFLLNPV
ncbi:MAG TPA: lactonase family protein [Candidatus Faecousia intestinigallinarum]|nr:lactonase family protein [Candidatus Faecousia intestinigallinarum]